jgi:hypothetical protein
MHAATRKQSGGKTAQPTHGFRVGDQVTTKDGKEGQVTFVQGDTVHVKGTNNYYPDRIKQYSAKDLKEGLAEEVELASLAEGLGLWKFNKRSGIWSHERNVDADTKDKWLSIFQKDEPGEYFVVSAKKPKNDPTKGKSLKTESVETEGKFARNIVEKMKEKKMDKVNKFELKGDFADRKDKDIDNDGDTDSSDEYLHARRKKIAAAIKKDK